MPHPSLPPSLIFLPLQVIQKVKGVTVAQASEASFQAAFVATVAQELHVPEGSVAVSTVAKKGKGKGSVRVTYTVIDVPKNKVHPPHT